MFRPCALTYGPFGRILTIPKLNSEKHTPFTSKHMAPPFSNRQKKKKNQENTEKQFEDEQNGTGGLIDKS
jgi:hypothetical protein